MLCGNSQSLILVAGGGVVADGISLAGTVLLKTLGNVETPVSVDAAALTSVLELESILLSASVSTAEERLHCHCNLPHSHVTTPIFLFICSRVLPLCEAKVRYGSLDVVILCMYRLVTFYT